MESKELLNANCDHEDFREPEECNVSQTQRTGLKGQFGNEEGKLKQTLLVFW